MDTGAIDSHSSSKDEQTITVYSVGHSNHTLNAFLDLLEQHGIQSLVDVRSAPYSKYVPHFNRPELEDAVERRGIRYVFMGEQLGGRPSGDEYYDDLDHVLYYRVAEAPFFQRGLERLLDEGVLYRTAIMCSEEDPTGCHRHLLIGRVLDGPNVRMIHIRANGREQSEEDLNPTPSLWEVLEEPVGEDTEWKSIRPVSRRKQQPSSSSHSAGWESDDF